MEFELVSLASAVGSVSLPRKSMSDKSSLSQECHRDILFLNAYANGVSMIVSSKNDLQLLARRLVYMQGGPGC